MLSMGEKLFVGIILLIGAILLCKYLLDIFKYVAVMAMNEMLPNLLGSFEKFDGKTYDELLQILSDTHMEDGKKILDSIIKCRDGKKYTGIMVKEDIKGYFKFPIFLKLLDGFDVNLLYSCHCMINPETNKFVFDNREEMLNAISFFEKYSKKFEK